VIAATGVSMNTMVLAGFVIAIGAVVDDAIIDIENILRRVRLEHAAGSSRSLARIVLDASLEVRRPIVYAITTKRKRKLVPMIHAIIILSSDRF